ncbi:hypothetical protein ACFCP7_24625 [Paenibacillus elgii]
MKMFKNIEDAVIHYKNKVKMPTKIQIEIDGRLHTFSGSCHDYTTILKLQSDVYYFFDKDLELETKGKINFLLKFEYHRFYEEKSLIEVYFIIYDKNGDFTFLSPVYFYNQFVEQSDYIHCIDKVTDQPKKWINRIWVNADSSSNAFLDIRHNSYKKARKDMFYDHQLRSRDYSESSLLTTRTKKQLVDKDAQTFRDKWLIENIPPYESPYFGDFTIPDEW